MDWLRRNWPDLLIGVALVAVIAGIIATLISGGSFFPFGQGSGGSTPPTTSPSPITGTTTPGSTQPSTTTQEPGTTATDPAAAGAQPGEGESTGAGEAVPPPTGEGIAVLPPSGVSGTGTTPPSGPSGASGAAEGSSGAVTALPPTATPPSTPSTPAPSTAAPSATTPGAAEPATATTTPTGTPVPASADMDEASYRVSVGAFGNADNAQRLAQQFQGEGYPVLLGTQGNLSIVLLGPYATDGEARRVANQVNGTFGVVDPVVYRFEPDDAETPSAAPAPTATPVVEAPAAAPASAPAIPTPPPVVGADRYLQVGAYANRESAVPQIERLGALGFMVTEAQEDGFIKLLVGPYQGTALTDAQSRLAAEGIENFARGL